MNFHAASHTPATVPVLLATEAAHETADIAPTLNFAADRDCRPSHIASNALRPLLEHIRREAPAARDLSWGVAELGAGTLRGDE